MPRMQTGAPTPEQEARRDVGPQFRALRVQADSWNAEMRTVDVIFSTGARVARFDWERWDYVDEELDMSPNALRMDRLNAGAAVLNTHNSRSLDAQIGVVVPGSARLEGGQAVATLRLSGREEIAGIVQDIADGVIRNISVGYRVHAYEITERQGERPLYRAVDWEPFEISFVPVPADAGAQVRSDAAQGGFPCIISRSAVAPAQVEVRMPNNIITDDAEPIAPATETRAADTPPAGEPTPALVRAADILTAARNAGLSAEVQAELVDAHAATPMTEERMMAEIGRRFAARDQARGAGTGGSGRVMIDEREKVRAAVSEALLHRINPRTEMRVGGENFRGMTLIDIGRDMLMRGGENARNWERPRVAAAMLGRAANGVSDFPLILANLANKTLRDAYQAAPRTFTDFVREVTVSDFKTVTRAALGDAPVLKKISEAGEITSGTMGEASEQYALATYARMIPVTRRLIINDDLNAFSRIPQMFARRAAELEGDLVYGILTGNRVMADGKALFHADHGNLAGAAAAINEAGLSAARMGMREQKGINGALINVTPKYLIVGPEKETEAEKMLTTILANATGSVNVFAGRLELRVDPRITGKQWFLSAEPAAIDTIELAYLEGQVGPVVEEQAEFDVDGFKLRCLFDVEAAPIDWRGFWKNAGA